MILIRSPLLIRGVSMTSTSGDATMDGRNPAPPDMHETLQIVGYLQYQLVSV